MRKAPVFIAGLLLGSTVPWVFSLTTTDGDRAALPAPTPSPIAHASAPASICEGTGRPSTPLHDSALAAAAGADASAPLSPEEALAALSLCRYSEAESIVRRVPIQALRATLRLALEQARLENDRLAVLGKAAAQADPLDMLSLIEESPYYPDRIDAMGYCIGRIALRDYGFALDRLSRIPSAQHREDALSVAVSALIEERPDLAYRLAGIHCLEAGDPFFAAWIARDPAAGQAALLEAWETLQASRRQETPGPTRRIYRKLVGELQSWARADGPAAEDWIRRHVPTEGQPEFLAAAAEGALVGSPSIASLSRALELGVDDWVIVRGIRALESSGQGEAFETWLGSIDEEQRQEIHYLLRRDDISTRPMHILAELGNASTGKEADLLDRAYRQLRSSDPAAAERWLAQATPAQKAALAGTVAAPMIESDPAAALAWLKSLPAQEERDQALREAVFALFATQPQVAAAELSTGLPMRNIQQAQQMAEAYLKADPVGATRWISNLPGDAERDGALTAAAEYWSEHAAGDPTNATLAASAISSPVARNAALGRIYTLLGKSDPALAERWLDTAPLSPERREELRTLPQAEKEEELVLSPFVVECGG